MSLVQVSKRAEDRGPFRPPPWGIGARGLLACETSPLGGLEIRSRRVSLRIKINPPDGRCSLRRTPTSNNALACCRGVGGRAGRGRWLCLVGRTRLGFNQ